MRCNWDAERESNEQDKGRFAQQFLFYQTMKERQKRCKPTIHQPGKKGRSGGFDILYGLYDIVQPVQVERKGHKDICDRLAALRTLNRYFYLERYSLIPDNRSGFPQVVP
jgi:hypothetical protein